MLCQLSALHLGFSWVLQLSVSISFLSHNEVCVCSYTVCYTEVCSSGWVDTLNNRYTFYLDTHLMSWLDTVISISFSLIYVSIHWNDRYNGMTNMKETDESWSLYLVNFNLRSFWFQSPTLVHLGVNVFSDMCMSVCFFIG